MKVLRVALCGLTASLMLTQCSVSEKKLAQAQTKIDQLKSSGVPDSALSQAKVFLYEAKDARQRGNVGVANRAYDSLKIILNNAQTLQASIAGLEPEITSLKATLSGARSSVSGPQLHKLDSIIAVIDSLSSNKMLLVAHSTAKLAVSEALPLLQKDEETAANLRKTIPGEWVCRQDIDSKENPAISAVEKKVFSFGKDGKAKFIETKKGQSGPYLKEDWEFISWGTYDLAGDTVLVKVNRFAAKKQEFQRFNGDTKRWDKEVHPSYDSIITDGSQDRFVVFTDLKKDFKKVR